MPHLKKPPKKAIVLESRVHIFKKKWFMNVITGQKQRRITLGTFWFPSAGFVTFIVNKMIQIE